MDQPLPSTRASAVNPIALSCIGSEVTIDDSPSEAALVDSPQLRQGWFGTLVAVTEDEFVLDPCLYRITGNTWLYDVCQHSIPDTELGRQSFPRTGPNAKGSFSAGGKQVQVWT